MTDRPGLAGHTVTVTPTAAQADALREYEAVAAAAELIRSYGPIGAPLKEAYRRALEATAGGRGGPAEAARVRAAGRVLGLAS